ncbi:ATP-binding protein [Streptomyces sp. 2A115]|uniref:ATP-binding protein n=1 Tax=Streptomyces sp. 2A115 TaxID=3457439 RepID=UPI003FD2260E
MPPRPDGTTSLMEAPSRRPQHGPTDVIPSFDVAILAEPSRVELARRIATAWLRHVCRMPAPRVEALRSVVSELCTNAILYGEAGSIGLRGRMQSHDRVRLEVLDWSPSAVPSPQPVGPEAEGGRGLLLVDLLVADLGGTWGFSKDGTVSWCEVPIHARRRHSPPPTAPSSTPEIPRCPRP